VKQVEKCSSVFDDVGLAFFGVRIFCDRLHLLHDRFLLALLPLLAVTAHSSAFNIQSMAFSGDSLRSAQMKSIWLECHAFCSDRRSETF
jgi:hypothetical protein